MKDENTADATGAASDGAAEAAPKHVAPEGAPTKDSPAADGSFYCLLCGTVHLPEPLGWCPPVKDAATAEGEGAEE